MPPQAPARDQGMGNVDGAQCSDTQQILGTERFLAALVVWRHRSRTKFVKNSTGSNPCNMDCATLTVSARMPPSGSWVVTYTCTIDRALWSGGSYCWWLRHLGTRCNGKLCRAILRHRVSSLPTVGRRLLIRRVQYLLWNTRGYVGRGCEPRRLVGCCALDQLSHPRGLAWYAA